MLRTLGLKGWYCIAGQSRYYSGNKFGLYGTGKCSPAISRSFKLSNRRQSLHLKLAAAVGARCKEYGGCGFTSASIYLQVCGNLGVVAAALPSIKARSISQEAQVRSSRCVARCG